jgi:hypothetical protein
MSEKQFWDWPPTMRRRRRPRVEVLEPEESIRARFNVTVRRERRPSPWVIAGIVTAFWLAWRYAVPIAIGVLVLITLVGRELVETAVFVAAILAVLAWRERRAGRPF